MMDTRRKRYLIASALVESINHETGKPFALRRHHDVGDMQQLLQSEDADLAGILPARKAAGYQNLAGTMAVINDDESAS
jgi:hypothetical protein